ncbi:hypothetical protein QBC37DRAFT_466465 [Rhypophila decipiens]|uniref:Uncharacterized protein n=1 Tax=Rhypophila decipiens TaxID=261697 RepID=A0AAN7BC38_9PEZI|nr:hypothetical protein QBC37DRAFT_466465 [Rhypophila decipiens]
MAEAQGQIVMETTQNWAEIRSGAARDTDNSRVVASFLAPFTTALIRLWLAAVEGRRRSPGFGCGGGVRERARTTVRPEARSVGGLGPCDRPGRPTTPGPVDGHFRGKMENLERTGGHIVSGTRVSTIEKYPIPCFFLGPADEGATMEKKQSVIFSPGGAFSIPLREPREEQKSHGTRVEPTLNILTPARIPVRDNPAAWAACTRQMRSTMLNVVIYVISACY